MFLMRLIVALLGAAWIVAFNYYRYVEAEPPGGNLFWDSARGELLFVGALVVVGALVARWWAPVVGLTLLASEVGLALAGVDSLEAHGPPPPLTHAPSVVGGTLLFALLIAAGVAAAKIVAKLSRFRPDSTFKSQR